MTYNIPDKRTKIICTMGPSVDDEGLLLEMIRSGMDIARLNFSHGTHEEHLKRIERLKKVRRIAGSPLAIMLDTKGPEIRTGLLEDGEPVQLKEGQRFTLTSVECIGNTDRVHQTCDILPQCVKPGVHILIDDGLIELQVIECTYTDVICIVDNPGKLGQRKSVNIPGISVPLPPITDKDVSDILFGVEQKVDFIAASFIKKAQTVRDIKAILKDANAEHIGVIAKIENADALKNIDEIIEASDGIMVARGDLGVEVEPYEVPYLQKQIIEKCNIAHRPVITATQMLESMTSNPRPTRAEAGDVANAIYDGTDCVMLSGETAAGDYPLEALRVMAKIAQETEKHYLDRVHEHTRDCGQLKSVSHAVGTAAVQTAEDIRAKCIVCPTMTGRTARLMSSLRAPVKIFSVAPTAAVMRSMQIYWGVIPLLGNVQGDMRHVIDSARDVVVNNGYLSVGDISVFTCGDRFTSPIKRNPDGSVEKFAPANVMYVVEIRDEDSAQRLADSGEDALMTRAFFSGGA